MQEQKDQADSLELPRQMNTEYAQQYGEHRQSLGKDSHQVLATDNGQGSELCMSRRRAAMYGYKNQAGEAA